MVTRDALHGHTPLGARVSKGGDEHFTKSHTPVIRAHFPPLDCVWLILKKEFRGCCDDRADQSKLASARAPPARHAWARPP